MHPLPNDMVGDATVVASVYFGEIEPPPDEPGPPAELWTVLLLHPKPPYFQVATVVEDGFVIGFNIHEAGERYHNIVPAVDDYKHNWGGDY